jgi:hypothetical protein
MRLNHDPPNKRIEWLNRTLGLLMRQSRNQSSARIRRHTRSRSQMKSARRCAGLPKANGRLVTPTAIRLILLARLWVPGLAESVWASLFLTGEDCRPGEPSSKGVRASWLWKSALQGSPVFDAASPCSYDFTQQISGAHHAS